MNRIIHTLRLVGGAPYLGVLGVEGGMVTKIDHMGTGTTVVAVRLNEDEVSALESLLRDDYGIQVTRMTTVDNPEQQTLRARVNMSGRGEVVLPCAKCPSCFWMDPEAEKWCNAVTWPKESVEIAFITYPKAQEDLETCPVILAKKQ